MYFYYYWYLDYSHWLMGEDFCYAFEVGLWPSFPLWASVTELNRLSFKLVKKIMTWLSCIECYFQQDIELPVEREGESRCQLPFHLLLDSTPTRTSYDRCYYSCVLAQNLLATGAISDNARPGIWTLSNARVYALVLGTCYFPVPGDFSLDGQKIKIYRQGVWKEGESGHSIACCGY